MKRLKLSTTHMIMLSFIFVIFAGTLLLMLPISSADGKATPFIDALFTATTSTCVTGLVVAPTVSAWSTFGHVVILLLIQIGGLGLITVISGIALFAHKKIGLSDRILLQDAFNLSDLSGMLAFVKKVIIGTFAVEFAGALLYMPVFISDFGLKGIWFSVFTSVSAFCNAGIDIFAEDSLCSYDTNILINAVTSALIILGGLGYIVWWDVIRVAKKIKTQGVKAIKMLTLHSKIVLTVTFLLIFGGGLLIFIFEYNNPETIGSYTLGEKLIVSLFQSVTTRTAGFASVPQENLTDPSAIISLILMFIGGSPVGTAGGIKTVTVAVLVSIVISAVTNKDNPSMFGREISREICSKVAAVSFMSFGILFISTLLLSFTSGADFLDVIYETVSATATVGLSRNLTSSLNSISKLIVAVNMYFGRIGPISLAVAFGFKNKNTNLIKNPVEDIRVG